MRIIAGGVGKSEVIAVLTPLLEDGDTIKSGNDMDAAMALKTRQADYYLGTCHTGAGASLGVLVGLLGTANCHTFGRKVPDDSTIKQAVASGAVAFGFAIDQVEEVAPRLYRALKGH